jgi:hypothetical protein
VSGVSAYETDYFAMDLPQSDASFVQAYAEETTEAFCAGHAAAFEFFGVPNSILYDNTKLAVARIRGDGRRRRTRVFSELQSHYLLERGRLTSTSTRSRNFLIRQAWTPFDSGPYQPIVILGTRSAIDDRPRRRCDYAVSKRTCRRIEEAFGFT